MPFTCHCARRPPLSPVYLISTVASRRSASGCAAVFDVAPHAGRCAQMRRAHHPLDSACLLFGFSPGASAHDTNDSYHCRFSAPPPLSPYHSVLSYLIPMRCIKSYRVKHRAFYQRLIPSQPLLSACHERLKIYGFSDSSPAAISRAPPMMT